MSGELQKKKKKKTSRRGRRCGEGFQTSGGLRSGAQVTADSCAGSVRLEQMTHKQEHLLLKSSDKRLLSVAMGFLLVKASAEIR